MRKPVRTPESDVVSVADFSEDVILCTLPHITEHLSATKYDDGSKREQSSLSVSVVDGAVAIALNDKDLSRSAYTLAASLEEALKLLEEALAADKAVWRPWKLGKKK